jgi:hypothetical protein
MLVLALVAAAGRERPQVEAQDRVAVDLEVLDHDPVLAFPELHGRRVLLGPVPGPVLLHLPAVDEHAHAVVADRADPVAAGRQTHGRLRACREAVGGHAGGR